MAEYTIPSVDYSPKEVITYEVYRGNFSCALMRAYHARLQFFLLFFIDRSSFINDADLVWEVILLFQKRVCLAKNVTTYHIVGYTTLYKFLSYPDDWKMRLSQILILPPYQRAGHGQKLLQLVYLEAEKRKMIEVNIEDPSPVFQMLRDLTDIQLCKKNKFFEKQTHADADPLQSWDSSYAKRVKTALRITLSQVRRCYEIFKVSDDSTHACACIHVRVSERRAIELTVPLVVCVCFGVAPAQLRSRSPQEQQVRPFHSALSAQLRRVCVEHVSHWLLLVSALVSFVGCLGRWSRSVWR